MSNVQQASVEEEETSESGLVLQDGRGTNDRMEMSVGSDSAVPHSLEDRVTIPVGASRNMTSQQDKGSSEMETRDAEHCTDKTLLNRLPAPIVKHELRALKKMEPWEPLDIKHVSRQRNVVSPQNDEEVMMIDNLDAWITEAEEAIILDNLDRDITLAEEREVLGRLWQSIEAAAQKEAQYGRYVENLVTVGSGDAVSSCPESWFDEVRPQSSTEEFFLVDESSNNNSPRGLVRARNASESINAVAPPVPSRVSGTFFEPVFSTTRILTKRINKSWMPIASDTEFQNFVVQKLLAERSQACWGLTAYLRDIPGDPMRYLLVASGTEKGLTIMKSCTERWIDGVTKRAQLYKLLYNVDSIVVDVILRTSQPIGVEVIDDITSEETDVVEGCWVSRLVPGGQLAGILGSLDNTDGLAIMRIGKSPPLRDLKGIQKAQAIASEKPRMAVRLCMGKNAKIGFMNKARFASKSLGEELSIRRGQQYRVKKQAKRLKDAAKEIAEAERFLADSISDVPVATAPVLPRPKAGSAKESRLEYDTVVIDCNSIEVNLVADTSQPLGVSFRDCETTDNKSHMFGGLWIDSFKKGGQLWNILGANACVNGAALVAAGGCPLPAAENLREILNGLKSVRSTTLRLLLIFFDGTDLRGLDHSKLVPSRPGEPNPRRRSGKAFASSPIVFLDKHPRPQRLSVEAEKLPRISMGNPKISSAEKPSASTEKTSLGCMDLDPNEDGEDKMKDKEHAKIPPITTEKSKIKDKARPRKPSPAPTSAGPDDEVKKKKEKEQIQAMEQSASPESGSKESGTAGVTLKKTKKDTAQEMTPLTPPAEVDSEGHGESGIKVKASMSTSTGSAEENAADQVETKTKDKVEMHILFGQSDLDPTDDIGDRIKTNMVKVRARNLFSPTEYESDFEKQDDYGSKDEGRPWKPTKSNMASFNMLSSHSSFDSFSGSSSESSPKSSFKPVASLKRKISALSASTLSKQDPSADIFQKKPRLTLCIGGKMHFATKKLSDGEPTKKRNRDETNSFRPTVPRKRRPLSQDQPQSGLQSSLNSLSALRLDLNLHQESTFAVQCKQRPSNDPKSLAQKSYQVILDVNSPLGAYFITSENKCKIHSVDPKGQLRQDRRICQGTTVVAAGDKVNHEKIHSHKALMNLYNAARLIKGKVLSLTLVNTDVEFALPSARKVSSEWSSAGNWQGDESTGWAGGAANVELLLRCKQQARYQSQQENNPSLSIHTTLHLGQGNGLQVMGANIRNLDQSIPTERGSNTSIPGAAMGLKTLSEMRPLVPSSFKTKPILKPEGKTTIKKSVKFSDKHLIQERYFIWTSAPNERVLFDHPNSEPTHQVLNFKTVYEALKDGIDNKSCEEFVILLNQLAHSHNLITFEELEQLYQYVKGLIKGDSNAESSVKQAELKQKKAAVNIIWNSHFVITWAMTLRSWKIFTLRVRSISLDFKHCPDENQGRSHVLTGVVCTRYGTQLKRTTNKLGLLAPRRLAESIVYLDESDTNPENNQTYLVRNNVHMPQERREIAIDLYLGIETDSLKPIYLGRFVIPIDILDRAAADNSWTTLETSTLAATKALKGGSVVIEFKKSSAPESFVNQNLKDVSSKLAMQIGNIKRFNSDQVKNGFVPLSANIIGINRSTLLHAAINIKCLDSVKMLMKLGADPHLKNDNESPMSMARSLYERAHVKMKKLEKAGIASVMSSTLDLFRNMLACLRQRYEKAGTTFAGGFVLNPNPTKTIPNGQLNIGAAVANVHNHQPDVAPAAMDAQINQPALVATGKVEGGSKNAQPAQDRHGPNKRNKNSAKQIGFPDSVAIAQKIIANLSDHPSSKTNRGVLKCKFGSRLRELYHDEYPDLSVKKFLSEAINSGVLVEEGQGISKRVHLGPAAAMKK